jgi:drug/metabolite transporter (DMT)-like permease
VTTAGAQVAADSSEATSGQVLRGTVLVVLAACCFGSIAPLTLIARRAGAEIQTVQSWRYLTSAVLLLVIGAALDRRRAAAHAIIDRGTGIAPVKKPWYHPRILFIAGSMQSVVAALALFALDYIPASTAGFLFYTYPVWVAVITAIRGTERLGLLRLLALAIALAGIAAMVGAPDAARVHPTGVIIALVAAVIYAAYIPVLGVLQEGRNGMDIARAICAGGAVLFMIWAFATSGMIAGLGWVELAAAVGQGVLSAMAFLCFLEGLRILGAVRTAITSTVEPFWTTLLGVLLLGQLAGVGTFLGGVGIIIAVILLQVPNRTARPY